VFERGALRVGGAFGEQALAFGEQTHRLRPRVGARRRV
jgi:hypothetical protein